MANTDAKAKREAEAIMGVCNEAVSILTRIKQVIEHNSDLSFDWANGDLTSGGTAMSVDAAGNLTDLLFAPADVSNAIGSLDNIRKAFENEAVTQGDHLGNLNKLARPL